MDVVYLLMDVVYLLLSILMIVHFFKMREHEKEILKLGSWSTADRAEYYYRISDIEKRIENEKSKEKQIMIERKQLEVKKAELKQEINKLETWIKENTFKEAS